MVTTPLEFEPGEPVDPEDPECYYVERETDQIYYEYYIESESPISFELFPVLCIPDSFQYSVFYVVKAFTEDGLLLQNVLQGSSDSTYWSFKINDLEEGT